MSGTTGRPATTTVAVVGVLLATGALALAYALAGAGVGVFGLLGLFGLVGCVRNPRRRVVADPLARYPVMDGAGPARHRRGHRTAGIRFAGQAPGKDAFTGALHANLQSRSPQSGIPHPRASESGSHAAGQAAPAAPAAPGRGPSPAPVRPAPAQVAPPAPAAPESAGLPARTAVLPAVTPVESVEAGAGPDVPARGRHSRENGDVSSGRGRADVPPAPERWVTPPVARPLSRQRDREQPPAPAPAPAAGRTVPRTAGVREWPAASDRHVISGSLHEPSDASGDLGEGAGTGATAEVASGPGPGPTGPYSSSVTRDGGIRLPPAPPLHATRNAPVPDPRWPGQDPH